jgi:hypothetical protein
MFLLLLHIKVNNATLRKEKMVLRKEETSLNFKFQMTSFLFLFSLLSVACQCEIQTWNARSCGHEIKEGNDTNELIELDSNSEFSRATRRGKDGKRQR